MAKSKEYSLDLKQAVIDALEHGMSQAQAARTFGVLRQLISAWNKKKVTGSLINKKRTGRPPVSR